MKQKQFDTGGPAFPQVRTLPCGSHEECEGLSVRDYFAAKAMQALLASGEADVILETTDSDWPESIANDSYVMADAMLKARTE
jgi:hypothetical protein